MCVCVYTHTHICKDTRYSNRRAFKIVVLHANREHVDIQALNIMRICTAGHGQILCEKSELRHGTYSRIQFLFLMYRHVYIFSV